MGHNALHAAHIATSPATGIPIAAGSQFLASQVGKAIEREELHERAPYIPIGRYATQNQLIQDIASGRVSPSTERRDRDGRVHGLRLRSQRSDGSLRAALKKKSFVPWASETRENRVGYYMEMKPESLPTPSSNPLASSSRSKPRPPKQRARKAMTPKQPNPSKSTYEPETLSTWYNQALPSTAPADRHLLDSFALPEQGVDELKYNILRRGGMAHETAFQLSKPSSGPQNSSIPTSPRRGQNGQSSVNRSGSSTFEKLKAENGGVAPSYHQVRQRNKQLGRNVF